MKAVMKDEESLWIEGFVDFKLGVKEWGSCG